MLKKGEMRTKNRHEDDDHRNSKDLRIAFWGHKDYADFYGIGGMQSYSRRLAQELANSGCKVDYVVSGASKPEEINVTPNLKIKYFRTFKDSYDYMASRSYQHVIRTWFPRGDRAKFLLSVYRKRRGWTRFHYIAFVVPDRRIKRILMSIEAKLASRNGRIICVSHRQYEMAKKSGQPPFLLLPPVPGDYFLTPSQKTINGKVKIAFLGVLHPDKGVAETILLFERLQDNPRFDCAIYAIHNPHNERSLELHNRLTRQKTIKYIALDSRKYSVDAESVVKKVLQETDIFVQPYQKLVNTVDTPLLLLEAMASLCAVLTTPLGSIPDIYGESRFLINQEGFVASAMELLQSLSFDDLRGERGRIYTRNKRLGFSSSEIAAKFLKEISEEQ